VKFYLLNLFGFFVIMERVGQIRWSNSGRLALFPDDRYEETIPFISEILFPIMAKYK